MTPQALLAPARLAGLPLLRSQSDERLVDLVRAGNKPAFEAIVARYRKPLLRYCTGMLPEPRAEDVVQQAFLRAYEAMCRDERQLDLRPWLYRIAHNTALNALRDRHLASERLTEDIDGVERPDQAFDRRQGLRAVVAAVGELPERQRDAIVLRELEGRSYEEIATELGVSGGAVRQLLNRARNSLRAGASALTPVGVLTRIPWQGADQTLGARVAEMCTAGAGAGAVAAKVLGTALVTSAVVAGAAGISGDGGSGSAQARGEKHATPAADAASQLAALTRGDNARRVLSEGSDDRDGVGDDDMEAERHRSGEGEDRSGSSEPEPGDDHGGSSGPSPTVDGSGSGSGSSGPGPSGDHSGSGDGSSDSSGPGPGSGMETSSSGPGSGGSGSGDSGSGDSGSGDSGSSSGPGSGSSSLSGESNSGPGGGLP